jgi:protein-S-isoprenylcysteine O-methyltransferase Ste14
VVVAGIGALFAVQLAMGRSWRVGVDPDEVTALVVSGPFAVVRNPIFSLMVVTAIGFALLVPTWVSVLGLVVLVVSIEVQVRLVEEPYLRRVHGAAYDDYCAGVGRFVPGLSGASRGAR